MRNLGKCLLTAVLAVTATTLSLFGGGWSPVPAQGPGAGQRGGADGWSGGEGRGGRGGAAFRLLRSDEVRDRLGLTPQQRQSLDNLLFDSARRTVQLRADLKTLRLEMARLGKAENPDRAAMEAKLEQISAVRTEMARLRLDAMLQLRDLLSVEQREALREIARERRGKRRGS